MDIRHLTKTYAVSPQITREDVAVLKAAGIATVICNRPDAEVPPDLASDRIREVVEDSGMRFVENQFTGDALSMDHVEAQGKAVAESAGPVLAYCASGNRSTIAWALSEAGERDPQELIAIAEQHGYPQLAKFHDQLEALARQRRGG